ncbi:MAG: HAD-IC family P-type ATPase [Candidatus Paceibacterota bacterium]
MSELPDNQKPQEATGSDWYQLSADGVAEKLSVDTKQGLSEDAVDGSRQLHGDNSLTEAAQVGVFGRIFKQFKNPLVLILLVAGLITLAIGHLVDTAVIFVALGINVIIGTIQEGRASKAFQALDSSQSKEATVIRDGRKHVIPAKEVVVGDIVVLEAGMYVSADMRVIREKNLEVNEAALTGEWLEVKKSAEKITDDQPVTGRKNMAYKGTLVASGEARGIVVAVGDETEVGKIAQELTAGPESDTPIQQHMKTLAQFVAVISVVAVVVIFVLGVIRGESLIEMLVFSIAVAVSVVPEGLPAAVTVVLALGMQNILDRGGLVKNLRAAETLGSTTIILTDKTGTLTQAKMAVSNLLSFDTFADDEVAASDGKLSPLQRHLLEGAVTSSSAYVEESEGESIIRGEPIERALVARGIEADFDKVAIDKRRKDLLAFSSENRFAASLSAAASGDKEDQNELFVSGAPEVVLGHSIQVRTEEGVVPLDDEIRENITDLQNRKSSEGKRLIAIGFKANAGDKIDLAEEGKPTDEQIAGLTFLGLIAFSDPVREDVAESIAQAKSAGVHILMVTGDNPETANFIAREVGIISADSDSEPLIGSDLEDMSDEEIVEAVNTRYVFARVLPNQKLRLAKLLQGRHEVVAMTGDGVNDAPALQAADIGVAVGSGTEVAKEASDLVLLDDSFSIIVAAIEEGRKIIDNLKKIIAHLLSTSFGGLFLIGGALVSGLPIPILTPQILWVNIVEGGLLTFVFAAEPSAAGVMDRDPKDARTKNLVSKPMKWLIAVSGTITGIAAFVIFALLNQQGVAIETIRTIMFVILTIDALFFVVALKNFYKPIYKIDFSNNRFLFISLGLSLVALFGALFFAPLRELLSLTTLSGNQWLLLAGVGIFDLAVVEIAKYVLFQRKAKESA